jgi:signal transduction histidine kinase
LDFETSFRDSTLKNLIKTKALVASFHRGGLLCGLLVWLGALQAEPGPDNPEYFPSVQYSLDGGVFKTAGDEIHIPSGTRKIGFKIGDLVWSNRNPASDPWAKRFRYQVEGIDDGWQYRIGDIGLAVLFLDQRGNLLIQDSFHVNGESPGWAGSFQRSKLARRREFITVPSDASAMSLLISSAGPADLIGAYAAGNIAVYRQSATEALQKIYEPLFPNHMETSPEGNAPSGWVRDGTHASMARMLKIDSLAHSTFAFGIVDNDPLAHADWRLTPPAFIPVQPGERLMIEWEEMYSVGLSAQRFTSYTCPPPGDYLLRINLQDEMGISGREKSIKISVARPYWQQPLFWGGLLLGLLVLSVFGVRVLLRIRLRHHLRQMEREHMVERERLRIARNIHDDLGARLTHILMVSGRAESESLSHDELLRGYQKISNVTHGLVASLYETVWSVNPQNDHLEALISYLVQITEEMCELASIHCRMKVPDFTQNYPISSGIRHTMCLVVKEILHNAVKHSGATEITVEFSVSRPFLNIQITDNGCGFDAGLVKNGNGLNNLRARMMEIGGTIVIEGAIGVGVNTVLKTPIF